MKQKKIIPRKTGLNGFFKRISKMDRSFIENEKRATMKPNLKSKFSSQNVTFNYQQFKGIYLLIINIGEILLHYLNTLINICFFKENSIKEEGVALKWDSIKRISKIIENIHTNIGDHNKKSLREIIDQTEQDLMKSIGIFNSLY